MSQLGQIQKSSFESEPLILTDIERLIVLRKLFLNVLKQQETRIDIAFFRNAL